MDSIGIDVYKNNSQVCKLTEEGELIEKGMRTTRSRFAAVLGGRERARILIEASTESEWVARCLEELGHEVAVAAFWATLDEVDRFESAHQVEAYPGLVPREFSSAERQRQGRKRRHCGHGRYRSETGGASGWPRRTRDVTGW